MSSLPVPRWLELGLYDDLALIVNHLRNSSHPLTDPAWEIGGGPVRVGFRNFSISQIWLEISWNPTKISVRLNSESEFH